MNWIRWNSPADRLRERLHRHRLGQAGHALDEQMAPCEQGNDHALEQRVLADDDALDLVENLLERCVECWLAIHCSLSLLGDVAGTAGGADRNCEAEADEVAVA